ncbi:hypothetical protein L580_2774 [Serratia fonticola AU-P3(3)]|nr:hypothetical protein L580_2774 [Serratia fonticola AU-P3(3)]
MDKLEALKAAALAATPGEWVAFLSGDTHAVHTPDDKHCGNIVNWPGFDGSKNAANNAAFIAAVNPAVVLELLAALEEANKCAELESIGADKSAVNAVEWMKRANAAEQREEHLKATVDVLSAKNTELEQQHEATQQGAQILTEAIGAHGYIAGCLERNRPDLALEESLKWMSVFAQAAEQVEGE